MLSRVWVALFVELATGVLLFRRGQVPGSLVQLREEPEAMLIGRLQDMFVGLPLAYVWGMFRCICTYI